MEQMNLIHFYGPYGSRSDFHAENGKSSVRKECRPAFRSGRDFFCLFRFLLKHISVFSCLFKNIQHQYPGGVDHG